MGQLSDPLWGIYKYKSCPKDFARDKQSSLFVNIISSKENFLRHLCSLGINKLERLSMENIFRIVE